ncbi:hypothetical protein [Aureispira anguillae]|uniref:Uncharacterized protein n=1 Tax=Aureispira anguillae TaxID=2864201 RepID=A0A915YBM0_9BACT|nr:hypothetical protein [Aureispira anguillae]BDS10094.1 hypothetical protein AsAng_0008010 [Aureispira anguillae]
MSLIGSLLSNTGSFDKMRQGYYDEGSACGFVTECQETKDCIFRICAPNQDAYGGIFYESCVRACNADRSMDKVEDFLCQNPQNAWDLYGVSCPDFEPRISGSINILGREFTLLQLASAVLLMILIYIIIQRI